MNVSPTQQHASQFVERNQFLQALLGLLATGQRVESWVQRQTAESPAPRRLAEDSPMLLVLLGVVSFKRALERHALKLAQEVEQQAVEHPSSSEPPCLRSLLK